MGTVVPRRSLADPNSAVAAGGVACVGLSLGVSARYADIIPPLAILACPRRVGGKRSDAAAWCELDELKMQLTAIVHDGVAHWSSTRHDVHVRKCESGRGGHGE